MERLRDECGEMVALHLLRGDDWRVVVDQAESHKPLRRIYTEPGEAIPLHPGALGTAGRAGGAGALSALGLHSPWR